MELDARGIRLDLGPDPFWPEREIKQPREVRAIEASLRAAEAGLAGRDRGAHGLPHPERLAVARRAQAHRRGPALGRQHEDDGRRLHPRAHDLRAGRPGGRPARGGPRPDPREHAGRDGHLPALGEDRLLRRPHAHRRARQGELRAARGLRDRPRGRAARPPHVCARASRAWTSTAAIQALFERQGYKTGVEGRPDAGLLPRHRPRPRAADPRGAVDRQAAVRAARRPRGHRRAGPLLPGPRRRAHRGRGARDARRARAA